MPLSNTNAPPCRVILAVPGSTADDARTLELAGLTVVALAADMGAVRSAVDACLQAAALPQVVVVLHARLPNVRGPYIVSLARAGVATVLLVDRSARLDEDLLTHDWPYPDYVMAQMERLGCVSVAAWPPVPGELPLCVTQAAEALRAGVTRGGGELLRAASGGGTIALTGGIGGSGKTTIACNLAALLAVVCERRVLLMDLDPINASVHRKLGLEVAPDRGLELLHAAASPLVRHALGGRGRMEAGRDDPVGHAAADEALASFDLGPYLVPYPATTPTGHRLDVLPGVLSPRAAARLAEDPETLHALVRLARSRYDDVILDLGTETATTLHEGLAARADRVLVVTWPMPDGVEMVAERHRALQRATHLPAERCQLVINHAPGSAAAMLPPLEIVTRVRAAGLLSSAGIVPHDGNLVGEARLAGEETPLLPVLRSDRAARTSAFVRSIEEIASHVRPGVLPQRAGGLEIALAQMLQSLRALTTRWRAPGPETERLSETVGGAAEG